MFESGLFDAAARRSILNEYALKAHLKGMDMPWLRNHVSIFVKGVLSDRYVEIHEIKKNGREYRISPNPSYWFGNFVFFAEKILNEQTNYSGCVDCVPYFVSILPFVTDPKERRSTELKKLLGLSANICKHQNSTPIAIEFARNLQANREQIQENWAINSHLD